MFCQKLGFIWGIRVNSSPGRTRAPAEGAREPASEREIPPGPQLEAGPAMR